MRARSRLSNFTKLDSRPDVVRPKFVPEISPVVSFIGCYCLNSVEITIQDLPPDLCVIGPISLAMNIYERTGLTVNEHRRLHGQKPIVRLGSVPTAGGGSAEAQRVDCHYVAEILDRRRPLQ